MKLVLPVKKLMFSSVSMLVICFFLFGQNALSQTVTNGSVTGAPAANNGINAGNAPGWTGCGFSPDLCDLSLPSYLTTSTIPAVLSPDGGTWLGMATVGSSPCECAQTTITGLTVGTTYDLCFWGANFGGGSYSGTPATPTVTVGATTQTYSINQVSSWAQFVLTFTATATTEPLIVNNCNAVINTYASLDGFVVNPLGTCSAPPPCVMDSMPIAMTNCYNTPFLQYDVSGNLYFTNPPVSGTLTITPCSGPPQVFNAPFASPLPFTFTGLNQTGTNCAFTAVFSADPLCTITTNFMSPPPITNFSMNQGFCVNGVFHLNGTVSFSNPPPTGTLTIRFDNGTTIVDTVINAPFASPENWSITAPANGAPFTITVFFSGFPMCTMVTTGTAPASCGCTAYIGTFNTSITPNNGQTPYKLCFGDQFNITSNGDFVPPPLANNPPGPAYNPAIGYLMYSCPPTIALVPSNVFPNDWIGNDPCFVGVVGFGNSFTTVNTLGGPSYAGPWVNNTIYFVPITFYDTVSLTYSYVNTTMPCYDMGPWFAVQYLPEILYNAVPNCQDSSVTVTITGGLPELDGSLYTASNLTPANASFVNNTCTHNGTIIINGLQNGDFYSFDIVDTNSCPTTVTGGPFVGLPNANAGIDDTSCTLSYNLAAIPSFSNGGTTGWTGPAGVNFAPANSPNATVTVPAAGVYTFTWTEDNGGGCISTSTVTITFNIITIPDVPTDPTCNGGNDGQIVVAPQGGVTPYLYSWNTVPVQNTNPATGLTAGSYTVTVTDAFGCTAQSTIVLNEPAPFTYTTASGTANCGQPDGWAAVVNFAGGTGPYTYDWGAGPTPNDTLFNLTPNTYTITVADVNGCDTAFTIIVNNTLPFTASITGFTNALCNGGNSGTATGDGSDPLATYSFSWNTVPVQLTQTAVNLAAGTYTVIVTDVVTGCIDSAIVVIGEPPVLTVNAGLDDIICIGGNTNISATGAGGVGPYSYSWNNALGAGPTHNVSPGVLTSYIVTITDANGCTAEDTVDVDVHPPLNILAGPNSTICPGAQATITANVVLPAGNGGPFTYTWDNALGVGQTHIVSPSVTTIYTVTLTDNCGTPAVTAQVTVTVSPVPVVTFTADTFSLCETPIQAFTFYNTTDTTGGMVGTAVWNFGDGSTATGDTVSHSYTSPGTYDITLTVTSTPSAGGCTSSLTQFNYVQVYADPVANFSMNPNPTTMMNPTINFFDESYVNIVSWYWNIGGLDTSIMQNPVYTFPEDTGHYNVTLTVTDGNGCVSSVTYVAIVTGEYGIYVPNAFTPDFDNLNDGFFPKGFGISDYNYSFYIFDRWGENIFESHAKFEPWNGTYKGKLVQNGVYVWKLYFTDINGIEHSRVGHVTIVR